MAFKMKGSAFKLNKVATKSALQQKSPMKGDKKMVDGVEVHPDGHEGHHRVGKAANQKWGKEKSPAEMKSPLEQKTYGHGSFIDRKTGENLNTRSIYEASPMDDVDREKSWGFYARKRGFNISDAQKYIDDLRNTPGNEKNADEMQIELDKDIERFEQEKKENLERKRLMEHKMDAPASTGERWFDKLNPFD